MMRTEPIAKPLVVIVFLFCIVPAKAQQNCYPTKAIEPFYGLALTDAERDSMIVNLQNYQKDFVAL